MLIKQFLDINECKSDPCYNGGTCNDLVNGYTCSCLTGFTDSQCNTSTVYFEEIIITYMRWLEKE